MNGKRFTNEQGMIFVFVLMVLMILSILGLSLLGLVAGNTKISSTERDQQSVYYIAEAGAVQRLQDMEEAVDLSYADADDERSFYEVLEEKVLGTVDIQSFTPAFGKQPEAEVTITRDQENNPGSYQITSTGRIGARTRTVTQSVHIQWQEKGGMTVPNAMAVFTEETITLSGGALVEGNIGTNSEAANTVSFNGGASVTGDIYVPSGAEDQAVNAPAYMNIPPPIPTNTHVPFELPPFPVYPDYPVPDDERLQKTEWNGYDVIKDGKLKIDNYISDGYTLHLTNDIHFKEIILNSNYTLTIDVGDTDKAIVVDHLNVKNGHINITGTGKLTLYVKDALTMGSGSTINENGSIEQLGVYVADSDEARRIKLAGSQKIFGSLYAETADIELTGGGGFQGHIFTGGGSFIISGGARAYASLLYAPHADFRITGGGKVLGSILSKTYRSDGGGTVEYQPFDIPSIPFVPDGDKKTPDDLLTAGPVREA
ncbi:PilX N-terminal domain-containing pilus assembly protein [Halobacillus sp. ACCC02827]|uniref:DUF7305 domain-containing protein n=1 Tax=Halobacillus sp. ACCC02827 TaxID=3052090 RepID=UPI002570751F|nr:PilX N-terminal domain-containing pilus assembly protein [Halobacillus sp. ACCC02827]WJE16389.1 PilX N-terminal domain-containing pilus assembly protein [Halobacillus sp. ACCC02827]